MKHIVNNAFHMLQADETKIGLMAAEMDRLLQKLVKFVKLALIRGEGDLRLVDYRNIDNQHEDDSISIGLETRTLLAENEEAGLEPNTRILFFK